MLAFRIGLVMLALVCGFTTGCGSSTADAPAPGSEAPVVPEAPQTSTLPPLR